MYLWYINIPCGGANWPRERKQNSEALRDFRMFNKIIFKCSWKNNKSLAITREVLYKNWISIFDSAQVISVFIFLVYKSKSMEIEFSSASAIQWIRIVNDGVIGQMWGSISKLLILFHFFEIFPNLWEYCTRVDGHFFLKMLILQ